MKNTIVSANWLKENLYSKDLVIIDASPEGNVSGLASEYDGVQITGARPVSLKKDLSKKRLSVSKHVARSCGLTKNSAKTRNKQNQCCRSL